MTIILATFLMQAILVMMMKMKIAGKPVKIHGKALFRKAVEILNLTELLCDVLPEDENVETSKQMMLQNAMVVPAKIKGAMAVDETYSLVMESAVLIKINMMELKNHLWATSNIFDLEEKYQGVLRHAIEAFKKIFIQWVTSFNKQDDLPDEWHLFNDPSSFPAV